MIALIDGDIVCYRVGFTTEKETSSIAKYRTDEMLDNILLETGATEFRIFLSDDKENNFRYKIDPQYKANRTAPKPIHLDFIKEHLIVNWGARIAHGMEADDALGIQQTSDTIICSIDKDLLQIPGFHYNFVKRESSVVSEEEGLLSFFRSIMIGDVADNIKGIYGIGPAKAKKILPYWEGEEDAVERIRAAYTEWKNKDKFEEDVDTLILKAGRLLKIKQKEDEGLWHSEHLKPMEECQQLFTQHQEEGQSLYTERITLGRKPLDGSQLAGLPKDDTSPLKEKQA